MIDITMAEARLFMDAPLLANMRITSIKLSRTRVSELLSTPNPKPSGLPEITGEAFERISQHSGRHLRITGHSFALG